MEFWSGFMGLKQNEKTFNLKLEIGRAVNLLPDEDEPAQTENLNSDNAKIVSFSKMRR